MKKIVYALVAVMVVAGLVVGCAAPAPTPAPAPAPTPTPTPTPAPAPTIEPITLKAVMFWPYRPQNPLHKAWADLMVEGVKERSNGELTIDLLGGPEVVPPFDQIEALRSGMIDISLIAASYANTILPETDAFAASQLIGSEEREIGFNDYTNKLFGEKGLFYLGRVDSGGMILFSRERLIEEPYTGFQGMKLCGGGTMWVPFIEKLGAVIIVTPIGEAYTGLERGVFDGTCANTIAAAAQGYGEVCKYRINHKFWPGDCANIMSLDTWNKLPKRLQDILMEQQIKIESTLPPLIAQMEEYEVQQLTAQGCQQLTFKPEDAEWYVNTAFKAKWEEVQQKVPPETYQKLRDLLTK